MQVHISPTTQYLSTNCVIGTYRSLVKIGRGTGYSLYLQQFLRRTLEEVEAAHAVVVERQQSDLPNSCPGCYSSRQLKCVNGVGDCRSFLDETQKYR
jgi:hypothetical protein